MSVENCHNSNRPWIPQPGNTHGNQRTPSVIRQWLWQNVIWHLWFRVAIAITVHPFSWDFHPYWKSCTRVFLHLAINNFCGNFMSYHRHAMKGFFFFIKHSHIGVLAWLIFNTTEIVKIRLPFSLRMSLSFWVTPTLLAVWIPLHCQKLTSNTKN